MKSLVFVGGSSEATRKYGNEIRLLLGKETHTRLWQDDLFELGQDTLESILNFRKDYDFAVLLFSADDLINRRGTQSFSPRDNILLEFGLFCATLGRDRTLFVYNTQDNLALPQTF